MKKYLYFVFILIIIIIIEANLTAFTQIPYYVPLDSLRVWYPFDRNANNVGVNNLNGTQHSTSRFIKSSIIF